LPGDDAGMTAPTRSAQATIARLAAPHALGDLVRQARSFVVVGAVSTVAYACLFTLMRTFVMAGAANAVALVITAIGNTTANRVLTFGIRGRASLVRDHLAGFAALGFALLITSGAIALLGAVAPDAEQRLELSVLIGANAVATLVRFLLLRTWVHRDPLAVTSSMAMTADATSDFGD
jgi:putative flippase GtrA